MKTEYHVDFTIHLNPRWHWNDFKLQMDDYSTRLKFWYEDDMERFYFIRKHYYAFRCWLGVHFWVFAYGEELSREICCRWCGEVKRGTRDPRSTRTGLRLD